MASQARPPQERPELEDEYPAGGPMTKAFDRKIAETRSRITKTAEEIRLEVEKVNGDMVEMSASFSVQLQRITSRVQGAEGNISTLTQTANSLQSQIITANGNISTITQTVSSISSSVKNLEGEVSNIQQGANKISMSVTGGLGGTASIVLDVNGNKQMGNLDLSNVRQSFANDNSAVTISGGRVTFNSGTFVVNSNNLQVTETGTITARENDMAKRGVTFGEIMLRLAPNGYYRFFQNDQLQATFGGGEAKAQFFRRTTSRFTASVLRLSFGFRFVQQPCPPFRLVSGFCS